MDCYGMVNRKKDMDFHFQPWFHAALNTFCRCNREKRERVQPPAICCETGDEIDVNAVLNRLCQSSAYGRIRAANTNTHHHPLVPGVE